MTPVRTNAITPIVLASLLGLAGCEADFEIETASQDIVGGVATEITTVPWQVSLQTADGSHFCGGSIVAPTWVVTASHCLDGLPPPDRVVAGVSQVSQSANGQIRRVARAILAPGYTTPEVGKDVALLELTEPFELDGINVRAIRPLKEADALAGATAPGTLALASGWGLLTEGGATLPDALQSVQVPIVSLDEASADYANTGVPLPLTPDQLPAGVRGVGGKDSCQGDSGGPLVVGEGPDARLAGVVSWGIGCARADFPGLYARVSSFAVWMDSFVGGPPTAVATLPAAVESGDTAELSGLDSTDVAFGDIVTYTWRQVDGPAVAITDSGLGRATFVAPSAQGQITIELTVTDEQGLQSTDTQVISVVAPGTLPDAPEGRFLTGGCSAGPGGTGWLLDLLLALGWIALIVRRRAVS